MRLTGGGKPWIIVVEPQRVPRTVRVAERLVGPLRLHVGVHDDVVAVAARGRVELAVAGDQP